MSSQHDVTTNPRDGVLLAGVELRPRQDAGAQEAPH